MLEAPASGEDWFALTADPLPVDRAMAFATVPGCGACVCFTGTVRDHAEGRTGVSWLEYEAYAGHVEPALAAVAAEARARWPDLGRVVLLHRVGRLPLTAVAVVVVVSAPHRHEAFSAARFAIDRLKETAPIWKKESWQDGEGWGTGARPIAVAERPPERAAPSTRRPEGMVGR